MNRYIGILIALAALIFGAVVDAQARIVSIKITSVESPAFEGYVFPGIGTYDKLRGKAYGEVNPADSRNAVIADIANAPVNSDGKVEYSMDIYILVPTDPSKGNGKVLYEINNRGNKAFGTFNNSAGGNNPSLAADVQNDFLMHQGYTLAWNGWDPLPAPGGDRLTITVPVLSGTTGPSYEYIVFDNPTTLTSPLTYAAASLDKTQATLTVRQHLTDPPNIIPNTGWEYVNATTIRLLPAGTAFQQSYIYEFKYTAKDPLVLGLGLASTRDFLSFLRYATADDDGNPNPLAYDETHRPWHGHKAKWGHHCGGCSSLRLPQYIYGIAFSQSARYVNDYQTLGFTTDEHGRRVFDGILNWLGGGSGTNLNFRFGQTGRTERIRQHHLFPEGVFPFAYPKLTDPYTGIKAGRIVRCEKDGTCPKVFEANSANEYWSKTASLLHTDLKGNDLPDPPNVRFFLVSGVEHTSGGSTGYGVCQQLHNSTNPSPALRALFIDLDQWVTKGVKPPDSEVPRHHGGTSAFVVETANVGLGNVPQEELGWPTIPGVTYTGDITARHLFNFGPRFDQGIMDINPPEFKGPLYLSFVSAVDFDGNEIAGIRLPPVAVPIATTTGWGVRALAYGGPDGCEGSGQWIPFKTTKAERIAVGDPRHSLQERYKNHDGYVKEVTKAVKKLQKERFLLPEDAQNYIDEAMASSVLQ